MDITPQNDSKLMSDDQELAEALAGVLPDDAQPVASPATPEFDAASASALPPVTPVTPEADSAVPPVTPVITDPADETPLTPVVPAAPATDISAPTGDLESIKKDALEDLRPLIDKVELPAEEKFDTYLMLIRSTDDSSLIAPAYATAQAIADEKRRAQALLDIVKEIDYLSHTNQPAV